MNQPEAPADTDALDREVHALTRYLIGSDPTPYVVDCYREAHQAQALAGEPTGVDRALLSVARRGAWGAALADAYAGLFVRTGLFRSKSVLAYGILESTRSSHAELDRVPSGGWLRLVALGLGAGVLATAATLLFGPAHFVLGRPNA